jgi:O-antigen biosynthesis protein WbqP
MKRLFDFFFAIVILLLLCVPMVFIACLVCLTSKGPALYWSNRIGKDGVIFSMPKFRSMRVESPELATDLMINPEKFLTPIGSILRRSSCDELPQLFSIIKGDMSFVGPRPALFNQHELIALRQEDNVDKLIPGLTGWAQINGRDSLLLHEKVAFDVEYCQRQSMAFDLQILWLTLLKVFRRTGILY